MSRRKNKSVVPDRNLSTINLEVHIDYWEEAKTKTRHYFLNTMDIDITQITNWLINNSKYAYDTSNIDGLKELYFEMCMTLVEVRYTFNYEKIGKIIGFLISDGRFYIKPYDFPKNIKEIHEEYVSLSGQWDEIVLTQFTFPYKTILSMRYEIQHFLMYLCLEGSAQRIIQPQSSLNMLSVMQTLLNCLELPMSLYVDSFHLRKLLYQISLRGTPAFSLQCVHPIITQLQYIFQLYYKNVQQAWLKVEVLDNIPFSTLGFSYLIQNFLIDNFNNMVYWKSSDYKLNLEQNVKPTIFSMIELNMPLEIISKLLVQGFYDIIEDDCNSNFVRNQFNALRNDINHWKQLIEAWNDGMPFEDFHIVKGTNVYLANLVAMLYNRGIVDWDHAYFCMSLIHNFVSENVQDPDYTHILLKYLCTNAWIVDETLHTQLETWFQYLLENEVDFTNDEESTNRAIMEIDNYY